MPNRLADELSPYLQQHAHNPVDWYPWGPEALARARAEDKPILLSIGYSACHWCHVMERESFDDEATAALMNERFVSVKVDREERPDLDQIYQLVVQLMRRSGGWPLTVFLTPSRQPFFGGTYFPPTPRYGMPDFRTVLRSVHDAFRERRDEVERSAAQITAAIEEVTAARAEPADPPKDVAVRCASKLAARFDEDHGGFGDRPKFPNTMLLDVMLRAWRRGDEASLARVEKALAAMREGGIHDQLGGGFHRYGTDARWLVPHFEKMLYDNALLARLYLDGWRATGEARWAETVGETLRYVLREMRDESGLFYSTQDADSEGEEGKFFVWTPAELEARLGPDDAAVAAKRFGVTPEGNFEGTGATVLHLNRSVDAVARALDRDVADVEAALARARRTLFEARETRPRPFRDEKILATWNGLMIRAFAEAGAALGEPGWVAVATEALDALRRVLFVDGSLRRVAKDGEARIDAFLEDWADVANAALAVHRATLDPKALAFARELVDGALERFWDETEGGFFFAHRRADDLIVRAKDAHDAAVPSGTSSMAHALLLVHALTGEAPYLERAEQTLRRLCRPALEHPLGFGSLVCALDLLVHGATEVVVVAEADDPDAEALLDAAHRAYVPDLVLARVGPGSAAGPGVGEAVAREQKDGRATAYVCEGRACGPPVTSPEALREALMD
ncbi:MAG TPA: thioredoxin domain-containing protein [Sandaracinaceae bacterium LLY-WYZ-13_1]|nr:thioredoxin domain-containing protein [Sandaracinaceae bacterium LLY-WYZ-13_1]